MQFKLGKLLGRGASGYVFSATEIGGSGKVAAVKKSRAPHRVKRPPLQHEGRLIQMLQGHPSIPTLFGYGRFEHFEYLSMELLGSSLSHLYTASHPVSIRTALVVTEQMLSALEHVHSHHIVHRDIKPGNIMLSLESPPRLKLLDFGLSRRFRTGIPKHADAYGEKTQLVGTVNYASLNSHDGVELSRRDDLESLFYSVLCLLRGSLPWGKAVDGRFGIYTTLGLMKHVHMTKKAWSGSMLADGHPEEFGQLLDQVRGLAFDAEPDYPGYFRTLESLRIRLGLEREEKLSWPVDLVNNPSNSLRLTPPVSCAVSVGQLVNVQILMGPSIQGYGGHGDDPAVWQDPVYKSEEWRTPSRPAVVTKIELSHDNRHHQISVLPLTKNKPLNTPSVSIDTIAEQRADLHTETHWPDRLDAYCYLFDRPCTLVAVETDPVPYRWSLAPEKVEALQTNLTSGQHHLAEDDIKASERLQRGPYYYVYARFTPLLPETLDQSTGGTTVEWDSKRGWFDELVKISNVRCLEDGWDFGGSLSNVQDGEGSSDVEVSNSYFGMDVDAWDDMGGPRGRSITLPHEEEERLDADIPAITLIVGP